MLCQTAPASARPARKVGARAAKLAARTARVRQGQWAFGALVLVATSRPAPLLADAPAAPATQPLADAPADAVHLGEAPRPGQGVTTRSAAAGALAVVPGLLVHGTGHLVLGQASTGRALLAMEGVGLVAFAAGGVPLVLTGASRRIVGPAAVLTLAGVGLFAISALADIYGTLAPAGGWGESPVRAPTLQTEIGYRYVDNPVFAYRNFLAYGAEVRLDGVRLAASAWFATDDNNSRVRALAAYRLWSLASNAGNPRDGSHLEWQLGFTHHAYTSDRFALRTAETSLAGRLDLARLGPTLAGSFAEGAVGIALQNVRYAVTAVPSDTNELLLARFGFGLYLGGRHHAGPDGEVSMYYDHRHDGFAAGLKLTGLFSGVPGHFGLEGRGFFDEHWGVGGEVQVGSAWVAGVSMLFRQGGAR